MEGNCSMISTLLKTIEEFDLKNPTRVIAFAMAICMLLVLAERSIYLASIEILFMNKNEKKWNEFFITLVAGALFTTANSLLIIFCFDQEGILIIFIISCISVLLVLRYFYILKKMQKCKKEIRRLLSYYEQKLYESMTVLGFIMVIFLIYILEKGKNVWSCAVIGGLIDVAFVMLFNPNHGGIHASNYCIKNNEKYYMYKKMESKGFLCGDTPEINNATWYKVVESEELQNEKIYHEVYHPLSKKEKIELKKIYKEDLKRQREEWLQGKKILCKVINCFKHICERKSVRSGD